MGGTSHHRCPVVNCFGHCRSLGRRVIEAKRKAPVEKIERSEIKATLATYRGPEMFRGALQSAKNALGLFRLLGRYIRFNSAFGGSVANLAGRIAARSSLFRDPSEPVGSVADRSYDVAAGIFFAAIDEFGSHPNDRKTHRALAQAMLRATAAFFELRDEQIDLAVGLGEPGWTVGLGVQHGYGVDQVGDEAGVFRPIGFHMGSEILAVDEFCALDDFLAIEHPELLSYLNKTEVTIGACRYPAYYWVRIHRKVEAEHFEVAVKSANDALLYYGGRHSRARVKGWILGGLADFAKLQEEFAAWLQPDEELCLAPASERAGERRRFLGPSMLFKPQ
jgi:hypothetical protein